MIDLISRIKKLYKENPVKVGDFETYGKTPVETIDAVKDNLIEDMSLKTLDEYKNSKDLAAILTNLPADVIYQEFGEDLLKWTAINSPLYERGKIFRKELSDVLGEKLGNIERSRIAIWRNYWSKDSNFIIKTDYLLNFLEKDFINNYNIKNRFIENSKSNKFEKYSLKVFHTRSELDSSKEEKWSTINDDMTKAWDVYLDTPISFGLMYNKNPSMIVSLIPDSLDTVLIKQIQGINQKKVNPKNLEFIGQFGNRGIASIDYKKFAVEVASDLSRAAGFKKIGIQGGENNKWLDEYYKNGKIHLSLQKAEKIYDETAIRLGFKKEKNGNYYKKL